MNGDEGVKPDIRAGTPVAAGQWLPVTRAGALVGLAGGLAFGVLDALPALLEGNPLDQMGRRLLALLFMALWNAPAWGLVLGAAGLPIDAVLGLLKRRASPRAAAALAAGLGAALSTAAFCLHRYPDAPWLLVTVLALPAGAVGAMLAWAVAGQGIGGRAGRWVGIIMGAGLAVLLAVAVFRVTVRDWAALNPRVTSQTATAERPNIVLISIDALRADRLGAYGHQPSPSPRIDELASRGLVFRQAMAQGSSTVHSIGSFLTSLYPTELGMIAGRPWVVDAERVTLAEALQAGGYRTQAYVANGHLVAAKGYTQGFDGFVPPEPDRPYDLDRLRDRTVLAGLACRERPGAAGGAIEDGETWGGLARPSPAWRPAAFAGPACRLFDSAYGLLFDRPLVLENEGRRINARAQRFIRLHRDEQFFLWLHYMEPHAAYAPAEPFGEIPSTANVAALRAWQPSNTTVPMILTTADREALWALYDGQIHDVDGLVGQIWDEIVAQGLADRTLLVLTADHGDEFADHGNYGHGHSVYHELLNVPLILVGPTVAEPGRVVDGPVPLLDLLPTLVDVAGAPLPELVRGQSLVPVLAGGEVPERTFYSQSPARRTSYDHDALFQGGYKLVYTVQGDRAELYDLQADPLEQHDLAAAEPERTAALRAELRAWAAAALQTWASLPHAGVQSEQVDAAMEEALRRIGY